MDNIEKENKLKEEVDMFYKSDELNKAVEKYLEEKPIDLQERARDIGVDVSSVFYDSKIYFIKSNMMTINIKEKVEIKDFAIVIPVFYINEEGKTFVTAEHWYNTNNGLTACIYRSKYFDYEKIESNSLFDLFKTKDEYYKYIKSELGEDTVVGTCILQIQWSIMGWQEMKIETETNKGNYMYSSISGVNLQKEFSKNFSNNEIYPLEEYNERIYPVVHPKVQEPKIEYNKDGTIKWETVEFGGAVSGNNTENGNNKMFHSKYFWLSIAIVLIATGSVTIFYYRKKQQKSSDTRE